MKLSRMLPWLLTALIVASSWWWLQEIDSSASSMLEHVKRSTSRGDDAIQQMPDDALDWRVEERAEDGKGGGIEKSLQLAAEKLFLISKVQFSGSYYLSDEELTEYLPKNENRWLWEVSTAKLRKSLAEHPWIDEVSTELSFYPTILEITIKEAQPWLVAEINQTSWLVSYSGQLLEELRELTNVDLIVESADLPRLDGFSTTSKQMIPAPTPEEVTQILEELANLRLAGGIPFSAERYTVYPEHSFLISPVESRHLPQVIIPTANFEDAQQALGRLKLILADSSERGEALELVDLRFKGRGVVKRRAVSPQ